VDRPAYDRFHRIGPLGVSGRKPENIGGNDSDGGLIFPRESPEPTKNYAVP
jgi:hypothetical protein